MTKEKRYEICYCSQSTVGYGSGTIVLRESEIANWLADKTMAGKPVLITDIEERK